MLLRPKFSLDRLGPLAFAAAAYAALSLCSGSRAQAQVLSPMEATVAAQGKLFLVQVDISNPYPNAQLSEITLLNQALQPIKPVSLTLPPRVRLAPGETRKLSMLVEFEPGWNTRIVYICHAIQPTRPGLSGEGAGYRGEVCGKVSAFKLS